MPKTIVAWSESPENPVFRDLLLKKLAFWIHSYPTYGKSQHNNSTKQKVSHKQRNLLIFVKTTKNTDIQMPVYVFYFLSNYSVHRKKIFCPIDVIF